MKAEKCQHWIDDFSKFCMTVDVKSLIATADAEGNAPGQHKQLYAIAIVRALHDGDLGKDWHEVLSAVCTLWERGHISGFSTDSFNSGLKALRKSHRRARPGILTKPVGRFSKTVNGQ